MPRQTAWERIETIYCRGQAPRGAHGAAHVANGAESAGQVKAELQAGAELRGAGRSGAAVPGLSCGTPWGHGGASGRVRAKRGQAELRRAGGMYGAAANAGDRHPQREGRGRRRMARFPHQNKGSRPTPSSPKQKKASALLTFFRCSVYGSNDPRNLHGNKPLPFGILSD